MTDRIDPADLRPVQPPREVRPARSERDAVEPASRPTESAGPIAMRLIPDLHDTVEISEEARLAASGESSEEISGIGREEQKILSDSWYLVGYEYALESLGKVTGRE